MKTIYRLAIQSGPGMMIKPTGPVPKGILLDQDGCVRADKLQELTGVPLVGRPIATGELLSAGACREYIKRFFITRGIRADEAFAQVATLLVPGDWPLKDPPSVLAGVGDE